MRVPDKYIVKSIKNAQCHEWLKYKHYAHRIPPIEYAFGLFHIENGTTEGVVTYGTPVSGNLRSSFGGRYKLLELNRLVINSDVKKNALSFLVAHSLRMLPPPLILVSYADTSKGHHGYIYQATNWVYTGLSAKRTDWCVKGLEHLHGATIADMSRGQEDRAGYMRDKYGDDFYLKERPRKHRYFYFVGSKKDKKEMINLLPYPVESYPKGDNERYDASYNPSSQQEIF